MIPMPLREYTSVRELEQERTQSQIHVNQLHATFEDITREAAENNGRNRTKAQVLHNAKTNVLPVNFQIGDYTVVLGTRHKKHKLNSEWGTSG